MDLKNLINTFREISVKLEKAYINLKKDGKSRKTPEYKKRRIAEGSELWQELVKIQASIDKLLANSPDDCYESEKKSIATIYNDYLDELATIPDTMAEVQINEVQAHIQKQNVRFETLRRALEDIEQKMDNNEEISSAFGKMKLKMISEHWKRIQVSDEEAEFDRKELPAIYNEKMEDYEKAVEAVLLFLQETAEGPAIQNKSDGVKVQRVAIPKFSGDYFKWVSFRDLFKSIVKDNKTLSNAERMQILKTNLTGEAETLIADLTIADVNFDCAWDRLINRYDNNRVVVYKHLNKLINQQLSKTDSRSMKKLLDTTDQILLALKNLGRPTEHWDDWTVLIITQKLSDECRKDWEKRVGNSIELPTWQELKSFMEEEFRMLEGVETNHKRIENKNNEKKSAIKSYHSSVDIKKCAACSEEHKLFACDKFRAMEVKNRWEMAKKQKLCFSCLRHHEGKLSCDRKKPCKKCDKKHSTWLHEVRENSSTNEGNEITNAHGLITTSDKQVLLATALVSIRDKDGKKIMLRALIDSGSQGSMISERAAAILQIKANSSDRSISVLGGSNNGFAKMVNVTIKPRIENGFKLKVECYILKKLTKNLPDQDVCTRTWKYLKDLVLADPTFHKVGPVDLLLGTDVVGEIMQAGFIKGNDGKPMAQQTKLGWIISGNINPNYSKNEIRCLVAMPNEKRDDENYDLKKFWELEELNPKRELTLDEQKCEEFYKDTHKRDTDGKFIVKIPFKETEGPVRLGSSKQQCLARFFQTEKKLERDASLKTEYVKVMNEYLALGHMVEISKKPQNQRLYYIPHHAVIRPDSLTTKTRVVFDASAKTSTGISLNDCMYTGAKLQNDLLNILVKWRKHKIVFKADIEKMYRQVKLDEEDQRYHTIIWRENPTDPLKEYQLTTATFGTAAAPFMAIRSLIQIANNNEDTYPAAAETIREDFYVDDLISGCDSFDEAIKLKDELQQSLITGGLTLRKWTSNTEKLIDTLPTTMTEKVFQTFEESDITKALGLQWNPKTDEFSFKVTWSSNIKIITKRTLLSEASKLFDPLGWLAPVIINAKLMMQKVWLSKIGWDDEVPEEVKNKWMQFREEIPKLESLTINRWINFEPKSEITLHGFCDASEKAYAAVIYSRIKIGNQVMVNLIASKTRVAPIKTKVTLPRLELCGAVLLATLMKTIKESLKLENVPTYGWSDSMIALAWLKGEPSRWKTFIANRVADIQCNKVDHWKYVKSDENPADCASRGLMPEELINHSIWWNGPEWLKNEQESWPSTEFIDHNLEQRSIAANIARIEKNDILQRSSSWTKLVRVMAYCLRMKDRKSGPLTAEELTKVKRTLYKQCQQEAFPAEMKQLSENKPVSRKSDILSLNPFLDEHGIIRVGGRLANANISFARKHPIILPSKHQVTKLIIKQLHLDTMHGGPKLMRGLLQKRFWIIQCKRQVNHEYSSCVVCKRHSGKMMAQMMGNLPEARVKLERVFAQTGVDYAGPIEVKSSKLRNAKILKGYIALFVCMGTTAVHLELVSDETTEAFLAAFNRFIARRGSPSEMHSDNGSNFVGAANQLEKNELHMKNVKIAEVMANKGIKWNFIPSRSPNFGGKWERNIRTMKDHLKKTLKTSRLTFEEYGTVLCQIEACMNSKPLCPLTEDLENLDALTPGHFLIGDALMAPPQPSLLDNTANKVNRWKYCQLLQQQFWNRWHMEYLTQLQQRNKWMEGEPNIQKDDMMLIKEEGLSPRNWLMGRVVETFPGKDEQVRVASLRVNPKKESFKTTVLTRPIRKLCPLLRESNELKDQLGSTNATSTNLPNDNLQSKKAEKPVAKKPNDKIQSHPYNLRRKLRSPNTFVMILAILGIVLLGIEGSPDNKNAVKITAFKNHAGIYFQELGRVDIIQSPWHIYVKFNLRRYYQDFERLSNITNYLIQLCEKIGPGNSQGNCIEITGLLEHKLYEISEFNALFGNYNPTKTQRIKRAAPLNMIGWAQHGLFGVMAAEQAEEINLQFETMEKNENHLLVLLKDQTSLIEGTINLMKSSQEEMNQNYEKIEDSITQLGQELEYIDRRLRIVALAISTLAFVNRLENVQENILDMLTELHQGHISSHIFTPNQFQTQLELINNNLPPGSMIPNVAHHDIQVMYKIIRGNARVSNDSIIMDIVLPLVSTSEFQALQVIPLPTEHEGKQITLVPESELLIINLKRDSFYQASLNELHTCIKPNQKTFMCNFKKPLYSALSSKNRCERDLLEQTSKINRMCHFNLTRMKDFWINLSGENNWIFGVQQELTMNVICGTKATSIVIRGTGLLEITSGCEATLAGMTLTAEYVKQSTEAFKYYPGLNLSEAVIKSGGVLNLKRINLTLDHSEHFNILEQQVNQLNEKSNFNTLHHKLYYVQTGLWILLALIANYYIWHKRLKIMQWCKRTQTSTITANDVELGEIQHRNNDNTTGEYSEISVDRNQGLGNFGTVQRHQAGECPFRT